jgi:hypothetical protein
VFLSRLSRYAADLLDQLLPFGICLAQFRLTLPHFFFDLSQPKRLAERRLELGVVGLALPILFSSALNSACLFAMTWILDTAIKLCECLLLWQFQRPVRPPASRVDRRRRVKVQFFHWSFFFLSRRFSFAAATKIRRIFVADNFLGTVEFSLPHRSRYGPNASFVYKSF